MKSIEIVAAIILTLSIDNLASSCVIISTAPFEWPLFLLVAPRLPVLLKVCVGIGHFGIYNNP